AKLRIWLWLWLWLRVWLWSAGRNDLTRVRADMKVATRLLLIPLGLWLAVLSFAHAASVTERAAFPPGFFGRSGIDSHIVGELVDRHFKAEMTALQTQALAEQSQLSAEELASLAEDPVE